MTVGPCPTPPVSAWFTPPQIARDRQLRVGKVLAWIRSGELEAVNCAERAGGRPRWRVSARALETFDRARSSRAGLAAPPPRRGRAGTGAGGGRFVGVIEFF